MGRLRAALTVWTMAGSFEPEHPVPNLLEERVRRALESTIRIDAEVSDGGMGVIYRGWHLQFERDVAVKVLRLEIGDADAIERFRQEAQVMVRLKHRHIIRVLEFPPP